jgi:outer membrane lipoprotein-sorting protein
MRTCTILALAFSFTMVGSAQADEKLDAKAVVEKAIEAHGGEAELKKLQSNTAKIKGTIHIMGMELPFSGDVSAKGSDQLRVDIESKVGDQTFRIVHVLNRDKAWAKINDDVSEMDKDQLTETQEEAHNAFVTTLTPLKDKAYTLSLAGEDKVKDQPVHIVLVSRKDRRDIKLFFDKKSHLLVKAEMRVKDEGSGEEMTEETFMEDYNDKGLRQPKKLTLKRDGKLYMEAEISDLKVDAKFDDKQFDKP